jgi:hypothetical protein
MIRKYILKMMYVSDRFNKMFCYFIECMYDENILIMMNKSVFPNEISKIVAKSNAMWYYYPIVVS